MNPDRIFIEGIRFHGHHGVGAEERAAGRDYTVDLEVSGDFRAAASNDRLSDTVDYFALHGAVLSIGQGPGVLLLETLAERMAQAILTRFPVRTVRLKIRKFQPPGMPEALCAGVEIERAQATSGGDRKIF